MDQTNACGFLPEQDGHEVYYEECGNPRGIPVVLLHGGPGGAISDVMRRFHDPDRYRIILFDQRGCGKSRPRASLEHNTTWHLVEDMERLRKHLGVESWQVFGGSWGSTLALAYAQRYPERVTSLIVRGIFTLRRSELLWFYQSGASWLFPDAFEKFLAPIPPDERGDLIAAYYKRLTGPDQQVQLEAARAWSVWEGSTLALQIDPATVEKFSCSSYALAFARIECHYFYHGGFFEYDGQLLNEMDRIRHLPGVIVQGRYDLVTPPATAWQLAKLWPKAPLQIVPDAGHAMTEPGIVDRLVRATRKFAEQ
nr:prolyl aminopeptidase [Dichotomicrobium thermohalophilum]